MNTPSQLEISDLPSSALAAMADVTPSAAAGLQTPADGGVDQTLARGRSSGGTGSWRGPPLGVCLALALGGLAVTLAWHSQYRVERIEQDLVRRLQSSELQAEQLERQVTLAADSLRDSQAKLALLEAKLADTLGQQAQLRVLYEQMARTRGDLMLADAENSVLIAAQQLQLVGNVQSALLALQDADQVLARASQPALIGLRRVIARDTERLRAVPVADYAAAVARLDGVLDVMSSLPMLSDMAVAPQPASARKRVTDALPAAKSAPRPDGVVALDWSGLSERVARTGARGWEALLVEIRQLVRVQRVDQAGSLLLAPDQRVMVREAVRLQLMTARLNLLARNQALFRADLGRVLQAIERWFDPRDEAVRHSQATLRQLQSLPVIVELPLLTESLQALRTARAAGSASR